MNKHEESAKMLAEGVPEEVIKKDLDMTDRHLRNSKTTLRVARSLLAEGKFREKFEETLLKLEEEEKQFLGTLEDQLKVADDPLEVRNILKERERVRGNLAKLYSGMEKMEPREA